MWTKWHRNLWYKTALVGVQSETNYPRLIIFWVFIVSLSLFGCSDEKTNTKQSAKQDHSVKIGNERLQKANELKKYGFDKEAQNFYEQIIKADYPDEVKQSAYWQWMAALEERESTKIINIGKDLKNMFPQEESAVNHRLLQFYLKTWEWSNAYNTLCELKEKGNLKSIFDKKTSWLKDLQNRTPQWQEDFSELQNGWCLTNPYSTTSYYQLDSNNGQLQALLTTPSWYHAGYRFHWTGNNTIYSFDIMIQDMEIGSQANFGFFRQPTKLAGDYLKAHFTCSGKKGDVKYNLRLIGQSMGAKGKSIQYRGGGFRPGIWYKINIDYVKPLDRHAPAESRMVVIEKETGKVIATEVIRFNIPFTAGEGFFGYASNLTGNFGSLRFKGRSKADNLSILTLPEQIGDAKPRHRLDYFYEANMAIAMGDSRREKTIYKEEMKKDKCPWPFWEMRALSYLESNNVKASLKDLKELVKRCPTHPTKPYLDRQIEILEAQ